MKASLVAMRTSWSAPLGAEVRRSKEDAHTLTGAKSKMMVIKEDDRVAGCHVCYLYYEGKRQHEDQQRQIPSDKFVVGLQSVRLHRCRI